MFDHRVAKNDVEFLVRERQLACRTLDIGKFAVSRRVAHVQYRHFGDNSHILPELRRTSDVKDCLMRGQVHPFDKLFVSSLQSGTAVIAERSLAAPGPVFPVKQWCQSARSIRLIINFRLAAAHEGRERGSVDDPQPATMRLLPIEKDDQLNLQALNGVRDRWMARWTAVMNQIRGLPRERGITVSCNHCPKRSFSSTAQLSLDLEDAALLCHAQRTIAIWIRCRLDQALSD
jgi:hypothetical protein